MKGLNRFFIISILLLFAFVNSCDLFNSIFGISKVTLTIVNKMSYNINLVSWIDYNGMIYYFGNDDIWDNNLSKNVKGILIGNSATLEVEPGNSPVYFYFPNIDNKYYTKNSVLIDNSTNITFTFTDATECITDIM